jgi:hypothetical protein
VTVICYPILNHSLPNARYYSRQDDARCAFDGRSYKAPMLSHSSRLLAVGMMLSASQTDAFWGFDFGRQKLWG